MNPSNIKRPALPDDNAIPLDWALYYARRWN
jgi:hypothetical protein